jgi:Protein of unknown function (DUF2281)
LSINRVSVHVRQNFWGRIERTQANRTIEMSVKEIISQKIENLSENKQIEVLDFIDFLLKKNLEEENEEWNQFSLEQAMKGLENGELSEYTEADLIEKWQ